MSKDLLREAIADAKAVKETAYANAKLALEEALAPHIQSMISAKLSEEMDAEDEKKDESVQAEGEEYGTDDMKKVKDLKEEEDEDDKKEKMKEAESKDDDEKDEKLQKEESEEEMEEDLDLEAIIRELEEELASSEIGRGENKEPADDASSASTEDPGHGDHVSHEKAKVMSEEGEGEMHGNAEDGMEEKKHLNIEDIINALRELTEEEDEDDDDDSEPAAASEYATRMESLESDLKEAYDVIQFLRTQINEVNLLNAKLLYSNKLFKKYDLNESQKAKVIDNFDRAKSVREVKLVYTTLAEAFHGNKAKPLTLKESFVSNPIPSTKPTEKSKEIISESESVERFKKLAGLK